jgi:16S rRNA processing protein RimM
MSKRQSQTARSKHSSSGSPDFGGPEFLAVGKLRRPHGVRGEMRMSLWTDFPERLQPGKQVFVGESYQSLVIKKMRGHAQDALVSFDGLDNREDVGAFRNKVVFVRTSDLPPLPNDELYLHQLLGLKVVKDDDNTLLGMVAEIIETGANHVFIIRREGKPDILLPDIDPVILKIDLEIGEIRVHLLPGLIPDDRL